MLRFYGLLATSLVLVISISLTTSASSKNQGNPDSFGVGTHDFLVPENLIHAKLTGSDLQSGNLFGFTVAVSGDTVVVASRYFNCLQGAAYVFVKPPTGWSNAVQAAKLTGSDWGPCGGSGFDEVAISGDTIVAGPGPTGKTAYVFVKPKDGWKNMTETARLNTSPDLYGLMSLGISGNTVAVGYPNALGNQLGAAAVFVEPPGGWKNMTQTALLTASDAGVGDQLGWAVAIDGDTVLAGAPYATVNDVKWAGSAYVFRRPPTGWNDMTQTAKLTPTYNIGAQLGFCLSVSQGVAVAGSGVAAYIFVEPDGGWTDMTPTAELDPPPDAAGFPNSVSISGNVIGVGAESAPSYPLNYGAVFVFVRPQAGWRNTSAPNATFRGAPSGGPQMIGYWVSVDGRTLVTGAPWFRNAKGIVYLFALE